MWLVYQGVLIIAVIMLLPYIIYRVIRYPDEYRQRFGIYPAVTGDRFKGKRVIWVHSSSVGEVNAAKPLIMSLKREHPGAKILLSTMTGTGQLIAKKSSGADEVIYFPLDLKWVVEKALDVFRPALFIMIETEIWPNFIREAKKRGVPLMIACGRVSSRAYRRYMLLKPFFRDVLGKVNMFSMQTALDAERIINMGADPMVTKITGSIKYDQAAGLAVPEAARQRMLKLMGFGPGDRIIVAGSTRRGEEEIILKSYEEIRRSFPDARLVIVPRHLNRISGITGILRRMNIACIKRTELSDNGRVNRGEVILVDTMGELLKIYSVADIVFVGGSLVRIGGHNILEPACLGKSVIFGPYMDNFLEIAELFVNKSAAVRVESGRELTFVLLNLLKKPAERERLGRNALDLIRRNKGSSGRNAELTGDIIRK